MNNAAKLTLFVLPLITLSVTLFGVKWKQDHPIVTAHNREVRQRLRQAKDIEVCLVANDSDGYSVHPLSSQEHEEFANHFWLSSKVPSYNLNNHNLSIGWGQKSRLEFISLGDTPQGDIYYDATDNERNAVAYHLHALTSRYLRQWLATKPKFEKKIR